MARVRRYAASERVLLTRDLRAYCTARFEERCGFSWQAEWTSILNAHHNKTQKKIQDKGKAIQVCLESIKQIAGVVDSLALKSWQDDDGIEGTPWEWFDWFVQGDWIPKPTRPSFSFRSFLLECWAKQQPREIFQHLAKPFSVTSLISVSFGNKEEGNEVRRSAVERTITVPTNDFFAWVSILCGHLPSLEIYTRHTTVKEVLRREVKIINQIRKRSFTGVRALRDKIEYPDPDVDWIKNSVAVVRIDAKANSSSSNAQQSKAESTKSPSMSPTSVIKNKKMLLVVEAYESGQKHIPSLAVAFDTHPNTIRNYLKEHQRSQGSSAEKRPQGRPPKLDAKLMELIRRLVSEQSTPPSSVSLSAMLSREHNVHVHSSTITRALKRLKSP